MDIAVVVPCLNEENAISKVVKDFSTQFPDATVYVYDNGSTDRTIEVAIEAGACVGVEPQKGKGNVVRRMFADIDADIYILVDGDDTYDPTAAPEMVEKLLNENLDMVVGIRDHRDDDQAYRSGHQMGNSLFNKSLGLVFEKKFSDIFSGYRVFSRRFVKTFPCLSRGFEIEMEMSIHAISSRLPVAEVYTHYSRRAEGTASKLNTYRDGMRIFYTMMQLFRHMHPLRFYAAIALFFFCVSLGLGLPILVEFANTGLVPRLPTAVLSASIAIIATLFFIVGILLDTVSKGHSEIRRLEYLNFPSPKTCKDSKLIADLDR